MSQPTRPYPPDFHTHYDRHAYNADVSHSLDMHDVLDPPELGELIDSMERSDIVYIQGIAMILESYGPMKSDGTRDAVLNIWQPF